VNRAIRTESDQFIGAQHPGAALRLQSGGVQPMQRDWQISSHSHTVRVPHSYSRLVSRRTRRTLPQEGGSQQFCQGNLIPGMQMYSHSTSKHSFVTVSCRAPGRQKQTHSAPPAEYPGLQPGAHESARAEAV